VQTTLGWGEILLRLILAAMVGRILGYNRTERGHPAGLRTMLLVAVAAALAMIEANLLLASTQGDWNQVFRLEVMRLPLGILSGIGFIGAGTILRRGNLIRGLTTAATIWFVTVIGLCLGGGQLGLGLAGAAVGFVTLSMLGSQEGFMHPDLRGSLRVLIATGGPADDDPVCCCVARACQYRRGNFVSTKDRNKRSATMSSSGPKAATTRRVGSCTSSPPRRAW
jgi:putative Mg2+ transporter-C (MgtC) family protein